MTEGVMREGERSCVCFWCPSLVRKKRRERRCSNAMGDRDPNGWPLQNMTATGRPSTGFN